MKLSDLDRQGSLAQSLQWLATLIDSPAVQWDTAQRIAAKEALAAARELMATDVLTLAQRLHAPKAADDSTAFANMPEAAAAAQGVAVLSVDDEFWSKGGPPPGQSFGRFNCQVVPDGPRKASPSSAFFANETAKYEHREQITGELQVTLPPRLRAGTPFFGGRYSEALGDFGDTRCGTCKHDAVPMHQEPCSRCTVASGEGGGHTMKWEPQE